MDMVTPRNVYLTAFYKRSFAYHTMKDRIPIILTQTIDILVRHKEDIINNYGNGASNDLKMAIGEISKLKYEVQTNKSLREINSVAADVKLYNDYMAKIASERGWPTYFETIWLFSECYLYRRIREAFENTNTLKEFDPFSIQKEEAFNESLDSIEFMSKSLTYLISSKNTSGIVKDEFISLLKVNLWGNKKDLSISNGIVDAQTGNPFESLQQLEAFIISDDSEKIWETISDLNATNQTIDIILDNATYELFTDFCLADYIISKNLGKQVRFFVKCIPWFVSDATQDDLYWQIKQLKKNGNKSVAALGQKWEKYISDGIWTVEREHFWTLPVDYTYMKCLDNQLYKKLGEAKLLIFKGDLNYRKLFGEKNWDPVTPVEEALQGFFPAKLCSLRTVKCDLVCGLRPGIVEQIEKKNEKWAYHGDYGLIQFSGRVEQ